MLSFLDLVDHPPRQLPQLFFLTGGERPSRHHIDRAERADRRSVPQVLRRARIEAQAVVRRHQRVDRKSTRLHSSHYCASRMPSLASTNNTRIITDNDTVKNHLRTHIK